MVIALPSPFVVVLVLWAPQQASLSLFLAGKHHEPFIFTALFWFIYDVTINGCVHVCIYNVTTQNSIYLLLNMSGPYLPREISH